MKRYISAAFQDTDERILSKIRQLKQIVQDALEPYEIVPTRCNVDIIDSRYSINNIYVEYAGDEYKLDYHSNIYKSDNITSIEDYENSKQFIAALGSVFIVKFMKDRSLVKEIQAKVTDIANSFSSDDGVYIECDFVGGPVYARIDDGDILFFPNTWAYYSPEGPISEDSDYVRLVRGNVCITLDVFEVYDILTSGVDSVDFEDKVLPYLKSLGDYYYEKKPKIEESNRKKAAAMENFNKLADYLETKLSDFNAEVILNGSRMQIDYTIDGWDNSYYPQSFWLPELWNMDDAYMKKLYTLTRKAINKAKNGSEYASYQRRNKRSQELPEW